MSEPTDEGIERLLRATGRRPALPAERTDRVREAVRRRWRIERRRRLRRRAVWAGVAAAAAVALAALLVRPGAAMAARVELAQGAGPLAAGAVIEAGATLSTRQEGRLACRLQSGHGLRLDRDTRVRFLSGREVALEAGAVYVDSAGASGAVEVRTPFARVRDLGTQFFVRLGGGALRVGVREGRVEVAAPGEHLAIEAGQLLVLDGERHHVRSGKTSGIEWAWAEEVAPPFVIQGRTAREFLDWVAREQGRSLRFESPDVAASASRTILQGSIAGMTPEQALDSVLPTCGMRRRSEGDVLHVGPVQ